MDTVHPVEPRPQLRGLGVYAPGMPIEEVARRYGLKRIVKLASNENPYGCSHKATDAVVREMTRASLYPESLGPELVQKLAQKAGVRAEQVLIGNGSDEIIRMLSRAYVHPGDEVVMADITFPRYQTNVRIEGGRVVAVPLREGVHDLAAMKAAICDKTRMVFVCNPNNPTGTVVDKKALLEFIRAVPEHVLLVLDEAYIEYVEQEMLDSIALLQEHPNLVILRTFSKIYGLAGLRIGYGFMHPAVVQSLIQVKDAFNTSRLAQAAALASLEDDEFVENCRNQNAQERERLTKALRSFGLEVYPSEANFVMALVEEDGMDWFNALLKRGVVIRCGAQLEANPHTLRISVGTPEENDFLLTVLQEVLPDLRKETMQG
ncbi:MAG: histidinol-phosphate transaminase [Alicyclobacillaceae bacterium]|uniref:histidinol-phosphate transaminase n=1 Tax=Alicyclobacillus sp. SP_1 TaxID=2942475 RepID=UPI002157295A|nr:histidinol-phosphate transaminase [Alicyclobacillus sp. SP_1]MCY0888621.1 histidinol-phosphate transaminase [Alicyclobacillaceae bacterium]